MTTYKYDGFGRLHEIIDPKQSKMTYDYDNNSNQTLMEAAGTDGKSLKFEYEYNNVNQLTYKKLKYGGMNPGYRTTEFGYTPAGDVASVINPPAISIRNPAHRFGTGTQNNRPAAKLYGKKIRWPRPGKRDNKSG